MPDPQPKSTDLLVPFGQFPTAANLINMTPEVMIRPDMRFYALSVLFRDALENAGKLSLALQAMLPKKTNYKIAPSNVDAISGLAKSRIQMLKTASELLDKMGTLKKKELDQWIKESGQGGALDQLNKAKTLSEVEAIMVRARGHLDEPKSD